GVVEAELGPVGLLRGVAGHDAILVHRLRDDLARAVNRRVVAQRRVGDQLERGVGGRIVVVYVRGQRYVGRVTGSVLPVADLHVTGDQLHGQQAVGHVESAILVAVGVVDPHAAL